MALYAGEPSTDVIIIQKYSRIRRREMKDAKSRPSTDFQIDAMDAWSLSHVLSTSWNQWAYKPKRRLELRDGAPSLKSNVSLHHINDVLMCRLRGVIYLMYSNHEKLGGISTGRRECRQFRTRRKPEIQTQLPLILNHHYPYEPIMTSPW